ncbi:MAG: bifunctional metallophosphatase/5'-nucleotidase [Alphaproteobacteria bacterium]|nr:MAG: bifunctional metallophosphatase/5'-nucleotidase [Alphaproteobacteria bacterium]
MKKVYLAFAALLAGAVIVGCGEPTSTSVDTQVQAAEEKVITLMFTNDVESAYDPIPAYWLDDIGRIGGIAEMTTLINTLRASEPNPFLFDSGDIFTGSLAKETHGELAFELMNSMGYDAMAIGNHEFEYGHEIFAWEKNRAAFPVLGANMFYKDTDHPYAQSYTIIERDGVKIGVVGIMGRDAVSAIIPSFIAPLDVREEAAAVQAAVDAIRDDVDLVVLLTHEGKTAPMQTDAESDPRLQRDIDADIRLAGAVTGVDVLFGGHADAGTPEPVVQPKTGTLIMQTYGQATHLGYLQVVLDETTGKIKSYDGKLIPVDADKFTPDPVVLGKLQDYREQFPELYEVVGRSDHYMPRRYIEESEVGSLFADILREAAGTDIAFVHAGSLRKDIPEGALTRADILDVYPFVDDVLLVELTGAEIAEVLEQSFTLERGLLQVSGMEIRYDLSGPLGARLVSARVGGEDLDAARVYSIAAPGFLAEGGDLYVTFKGKEILGNAGRVSDLVIAHIQSQDLVASPPLGRMREVDPAP